jgi:hypothetical protein
MRGWRVAAWGSGEWREVGWWHAWQVEGGATGNVVERWQVWAIGPNPMQGARWFRLTFAG